MIEKEDCKTLEEYCEKATQYYKDQGYSHTPLHVNFLFIKRVMLTHLKKLSSGICMESILIGINPLMVSDLDLILENTLLKN